MEASVSVIIPCYRCSNTIERAVDSVARQTLRPAEVILVEDDSGDGTLEKLKELQQQYGKEWIKVVALESNSGPSIARNTGWNLASQDFIAFLDADDAWHPEKIEIQYSWMLVNPQALGCGHAYELVQANSPRLNYGEIISAFTVRLVTPNQILLTNPFVTPSIMLKRKIDYRFDTSKKYAEDHFLWMEICLDGCQLYYLDIKATLVFETSGSLSRNKLHMRYSGINNYWRLWKKQKIDLSTMIFYVQYTSLKAVLSILFPKLHLFFRQKLELFLFN
jgi:glycosyltransferase involved in cell wall biosynthesis